VAVAAELAMAVELVETAEIARTTELAEAAEIARTAAAGAGVGDDARRAVRPFLLKRRGGDQTD
jgi:hypothetical protein